YAIEIAEKYNVYASIALAQAALESAWGTSLLAYSPTYNLFGIKASAGDSFFTKYSKEYSKTQGWIFVPSNFKQYQNFKGTFEDYALKIRKAPDWKRRNESWSPEFYAGSWKENTNSYEEAT